MTLIVVFLYMLIVQFLLHLFEKHTGDFSVKQSHFTSEYGFGFQHAILDIHKT